MNPRNFKKHNNAIIENKEFKELNHNISLLDTWEENADFILNWADNVLIQTDTPNGKALTNLLY